MMDGAQGDDNDDDSKILIVAMAETPGALLGVGVYREKSKTMATLRTRYASIQALELPDVVNIMQHRTLLISPCARPPRTVW